MITVNKSPLSVNRCWAGRRFKTKDYKNYEADLLSSLPAICLPTPPFAVNLIFGLSNIMSDVDNPAKPFMDILQKRYAFNDRHVLELHLYKQKVEKGGEFIKFEIFSSTEQMKTMLCWREAKGKKKSEG